MILRTVCEQESTLVGALADKTAFSASGMIDVAGEVPIFVPLYKKRGHLAGKVELRERSESLGGADTADAVGQFNWYKPAPPEDSSSLSGIDQALDFRAAYYTAPSKGERALSSFDPDGTGRLQLEGGNLESLERALTWSSSDQIAVGPGEGQVTIAVNAKTGFFKGKWKRDGTRAIPLRGVLFQKSGGIGIGSFIHGLESGSVLMTGDGPQTD